MTRTYAAKRLLELGPLSWPEFVQITGWPEKPAARTLDHLVNTGTARYEYQWSPAHAARRRTKVRVYALATN